MGRSRGRGLDCPGAGAGCQWSVQVRTTSKALVPTVTLWRTTGDEDLAVGPADWQVKKKR